MSHLTFTPAKKLQSPEKKSLFISIVGGKPPEPETTGSYIIISVSPEIPLDVGAHSAHDVEFLENGAFMNTDLFGDFFGGAGQSIKVEIDKDTARRLFTLICVLHIRR